MSDEQQQELASKLGRLIRQYDPWHDSALNFDDFGAPSKRQVNELELMRAGQMTHYTRLIMAAAKIDHPELNARRDAITLAAAGSLNWQRRQEFDMFIRHASMGGAAATAALRRMDNASAVINLMPEPVIAEDGQRTVLENDQRRMNAIRSLQA